MENKLIFFTSICMFVLVAGSEEVKNVFVLAGQSNMQGLGGVIDNNYVWDGFVPEQCQPNPQIFRLNPTFTWEEAHEPLHLGIGAPPSYPPATLSGIGPGMPFANYLLRRDPTFGPIGLVPCAVGATAMEEWIKGSILYNNTLARVDAALKIGDGGVLRGVLWFQGEKDAYSDANAAMYKTRFKAFVNDLRFDLNSPLLPLIEVALGLLPTNTTRVGIDMVRQAQLESAAEVANLTCADSRGLELQSDSLHITSYGQVLLGEQLGTAFLYGN